mmetsp:Transcript_14449/g.31739  ORF Transcript_14449/g.31739 Transcript_14449/m.31739 type:complete len:293 (+) Transcript_14449:1172-2050(+)
MESGGFVRDLPLFFLRKCPFQFLRETPPGYHRTQTPLEARHGLYRNCPGGSSRKTLLPKAFRRVQQAAGPPNRRRGSQVSPATSDGGGLDHGRIHQRASAEKNGPLSRQDRLSRPMDRLRAPHHRRNGWVLGHGLEGTVLHQLGPKPRNERAHRPEQMVHDPADHQRLLSPQPQRGRLSGSHPAASLFHQRCRSRREFRSDGRGGRSRNDSRFRRQGQRIQLRRRAPKLVDGSRRQRVRRARRRHGPTGGRVRGPRPSRTGNAHFGREHRRPGRATIGPARAGKERRVRRVE